LYASYIKDYAVVSIEDPFDQDHSDAWIKMTAKVGQKCQIVGDNLLASNPARIKTAISKRSCNALALNMSDIGTVSETIEAVRLAKQANWGVTCSNRSGETDDDFISHLAVGLCTGQITAGAPCRSERICKYNELLRIEEELGDEALYAGEKFRSPGHPF